jgi:integrase
MVTKSSGSKPTDPIRSIRHIRSIKNMLKAKGKHLQYLYFVVAINSGLRPSDLLELSVDDLWDEDGKSREEFTQHTKKTGAFIVTQINQSIKEAMKFAAPAIQFYDPDASLFPITRHTARNWIKSWCNEVGIEKGNYSAHSTRKTCAFHLWAIQGKTFEALMVVSKALGHQSVSQTQDYLGINREKVADWQGNLNL